MCSFISMKNSKKIDPAFLEYTTFALRRSDQHLKLPSIKKVKIFLRIRNMIGSKKPYLGNDCNI